MNWTPQNRKGKWEDLKKQRNLIKLRKGGALKKFNNNKGRILKNKIQRKLKRKEKGVDPVRK